MIASLLAALFLHLPGATNPAVTPATIHQTICVPGYSSSVRPSTSFTGPLKRILFGEQRLPGTVADYQLDHAISLELGGAPRDLRNLWLEAYPQARVTDRWENRWHRRVCDGSWGLRYAQRVELRFKRDRG